MDIRVTVTDHTITITGIGTKNPTIFQADEIMRQISTAIDEQKGIVKLSGMWLVVGEGSRGAGHNEHMSRSFDKTISNTFNRTVVRMF